MSKIRHNWKKEYEVMRANYDALSISSNAAFKEAYLLRSEIKGLRHSASNHLGKIHQCEHRLRGIILGLDLRRASLEFDTEQRLNTTLAQVAEEFSGVAAIYNRINNIYMTIDTTDDE